MASREPLLRKWTPVGSDSNWSYLGRALSFWSYPTLFPFAVFSHSQLTPYNCRWWRATFTALMLGGTALHTALWYRLVKKGGMAPQSAMHVLPQCALLLGWENTFWWMRWIATELLGIINLDRTGNRLIAGKLHGPRVLVVGNGPSAMEGDQYGQEIDGFDEVVRFNNFQNKVAGLERWVGTKTTVHFSDGVLYPTFTEYHVPGATIMLSLFSDRFMVAGSYMILRSGADLQYTLCKEFFYDPETTWIDKESIERLKKAVGLTGVKHPTSGMLAIDYFLRKPGVKLPVVIHGFDFFQGPKIHYYHDQEPLYERINNYIGVNMHSPHKEKVYVEKLIEQGKVVFLKDLPRSK